MYPTVFTGGAWGRDLGFGIPGFPAEIQATQLVVLSGWGQAKAVGIFTLDYEGGMGTTTKW